MRDLAEGVGLIVFLIVGVAVLVHFALHMDASLN